MEITPLLIILGLVAAAFVGLAKTGVPGVSILPVIFMAEAFYSDAKLSVGVLLPILLVGDVTALLYYRRHARWSKLVRLFPFVALGMIPGYFLLMASEANELRPVLGGLILFLLCVEAFRRYSSSKGGCDGSVFGKTADGHSMVFIAVVGMLAGFGTFVGHAGGPVMSVYLVAMGLEKEEFVGTAAWFFLIVNLVKVPAYCTLGMITVDTLRLDAMIAAGVFLGGAAGIWILSRISQSVFTGMVLLLAAVAALHMLFS